MTIIGIDIGVQGAIAILDRSGSLIAVLDMPALKEGKSKRRTINAPLLSDIVFKSYAKHAFVEDVWSRPANGCVAAFTFGRAKGLVEGVLAAAGVPVTFIAPQSWKRSVRLTLASKDASRAEAIRRWPAHADLFKRKLDDGRAEACLIAIAGLMREHVPGVRP